MILMCIIICIFLIVCVLSLHDRDDTDDLKSKTCLENPVFGKQPWYWYFYYGIYFSQHVWLMVNFNIFFLNFLIYVNFSPIFQELHIMNPLSFWKPEPSIIRILSQRLIPVRTSRVLTLIGQQISFPVCHVPNFSIQSLFHRSPEIS